MVNSRQILFYLPDWIDTLDPAFDFVADQFSENRSHATDQYIHELISPAPYDGVLISRAVIEKSEARYNRITTGGVRAEMRIPHDLGVLGDCGAFSYVNEYEMPYEPSDILEFYASAGVDHGVAPDHLIVPTIRETALSPMGRGNPDTAVPMPEKEMRRRQELTLSNAQEFLRLHKKSDASFTPMGSAQGWDPSSYAASVDTLLRMGYRYIAIGGLARSRTHQIIPVLDAVTEAVNRSRVHRKDKIRFHLFAVAKLDIIMDLAKYRVASIDSASYLRKAWLRSGQNYLTHNSEWYTAIRVPQSSSARVQKYISQNGKRLEDVARMEASILRRLNEHGRARLGNRQLGKLLADIFDYDMYLFRAGTDGQAMRERAVNREKYRRTLVDRPWESCPCPICKEIGIHALIFRGTNRNKRRGFHNTWIFHQLLRRPGTLMSGPIRK